MNDENYHLCLYYSPTARPRIIQRDFESIYEIDLITRRFNDEQAFRNDKHYKAEIARCQYSLFKYIEKIKKNGAGNERLEGNIYIVKGNQFIKPYYNSTAMSHNRLIESIVGKLKIEKDNKLMVDFLDHFKSIFYTDFSRTLELGKYKNFVNQYPTKKVESYYNERDYNILLESIDHILRIDYVVRAGNKKSLDENHLFLYRQMNDYLDDKIKSMRKEEEKKIEITVEEKEPQKEYDSLDYFYKQDELLPIKEQHYMDGEETHDPSLISFDDLPNIMKKYESEEKKKNEIDSINVNSKDIPKLVEKYKREKVTLQQVIKEQKLKEDKEKVFRESNGNFYIDGNGQIAFTKTEENRDREELPDNYENEGRQYR